MGGKTQTGTSDRDIAMQRRFELEGDLRDPVATALRQERFCDDTSQHQQAVRSLKLSDQPYEFTYDEEAGDVLLTRARAPM